jgi:hypothetical protein
MMRILPGLLAALLIVGGCGDSDPGGVADDARLHIGRDGGIAGVSESWTVDAAGTVVDAGGATRRVDVEAVRALFEQATASGFFSMKAAYLPDDPCCDRFRYTIEIVNGDRSNVVTTMDDTEDAPDELWDLIAGALELLDG